MALKYFKNTSQYPTREVKKLVWFALQGLDIDTDTLAINVKGSQHSHRGRAYQHVPGQSPWITNRAIKNLIVVAIGAPELFPSSNVWDHAKYTLLPGMTNAEALRITATTNREIVQRMKKDYTFAFYERTYERHGYGGKSSPQIIYNNWREALVGVTAHEGWHIVQFRKHLKLSEVACEHEAAAAINLYRQQYATASQ